MRPCCLAKSSNLISIYHACKRNWLEVLNHFGFYCVLVARDGREAVELYEKNRKDIVIVLLDVVMPRISGSQTYDRLKQIDPDVRVLLSSGYGIEGKAMEIMERGCDGFIQKPFTMKELSQKIREIQDKKRG